MSKPIPIKDRIIGYLRDTRPVANFYDLMILGPTNSVNAAIAELLGAGALEEVEAGGVVCVRLREKESPRSA